MAQRASEFSIPLSFQLLVLVIDPIILSFMVGWLVLHVPF